MTLELRNLKPFGRGGNRLCFVHPQHSDRCIKVRRPDFTLEQLRRSKGFPKSLRPLSSFDDNAEEYRTIQLFERLHGKKIYRHLSRYYGFEETDLGPGLTSELIRDANGKISYSLKQYILEQGLTDSAKNAINELCDFWEANAIPSRALLLHNVVVQQDDQGQATRLVVIDGLGSPNLIPAHWLPKAVQKSKTRKKLVDFRQRIKRLLVEIQKGKSFSKMGMLLHDGSEHAKR